MSKAEKVFLLVLAWMLVAVELFLLTISTTWFIFATLVVTLVAACITVRMLRDA
jgi:membrane protein implicated in regulation of membrane protease activity